MRVAVGLGVQEVVEDAEDDGERERGVEVQDHAHEDRRRGEQQRHHHGCRLLLRDSAPVGRILRLVDAVRRRDVRGEEEQEIRAVERGGECEQLLILRRAASAR